MTLSLLVALSLPAFIDKTAELGLTLTTDAACWVDLDNDGWPDLCAGNVIWRNESGKKFTKVGEASNVVAADFDNDGYADLFSWSSLKLYRNKAGKAFEDVALPALPATVSRGACWGDFNNDGFVDLYVGGYEDWDKGITYPSMVLMNQAGKSFKVTWTDARFRARGVTACDFDRDGDLDIYVSNYRLQPNLLWQNDGRGNLRDVAPALNAVATSEGFAGGHSIGAAWGDFDNDGVFDLFAGNFAHVDSRGDQPKSRFLKNLGKARGYKFEDKGPCGVFYQESYATPAAGDFDNDGNLDLFFTTVYATASFGKPNFPVLFQNRGNFTFTDVTEQAGLAKLPATYQAAWADFDRDGDLDLATGGKLFVNQLSGSNWVEVRLKGRASAIGAQVRLAAGGKTLTRQVESGTGEGNQNDLTLHFGLGSYQGNVDLEVIWPGGKRQAVKRVKQKQILTVVNR